MSASRSAIDALNNARLTRRAFAASLLCLPLAGCSDSEAVAVRYRVIARFSHNRIPFEASTVMECSYRRIRNSLIGAGGSTRLKGEAMIVNMPGGKSMFVLPYARDPNGGMRQFYEFALTKTLGIKRGIGSLRDEDLARLKSASGRFPLFDKGGLPAMVAFGDESDPRTIFEIAPWSKYPKFPDVRRISDVFPGLSFHGMEIEVTDAPVTERLREKLPWLKGSFGSQVFEQIGGNVAMKDMPMRHVISRAQFFGNASR